MANKNRKMGRPTKRPSAEEMVGLLKEHSTDEIGKMYGVSENTVRNWIKILLIPNGEKKREETKSHEFTIKGDRIIDQSDPTKETVKVDCDGYMEADDYLKFLASMVGLSGADNRALAELCNNRRRDPKDGSLKLFLGDGELARIAGELGMSTTWLYQTIRRLVGKGYMLRTSKNMAIYKLNDVIFQNMFNVYGFSVDYRTGGDLVVIQKIIDWADDFNVDEHTSVIIMPQIILVDRLNSRFAWILANEQFDSTSFYGDELICVLERMPVMTQHLDDQEYTAAYYHKGSYVQLKEYQMSITWSQQYLQYTRGGMR